MPCHILCPECGNALSEVYDFILLAKQGYYKAEGEKITKQARPDKLELYPNISKPIGFILDAAGLDLICCRMHILGVTRFDQVYR